VAFRSLEDAKARLEDVNEMIAETDAKFRGKKFDEDVAAVWRGLQQEREELLAEVGEISERKRYLAELAADPRNVESAWEPPRRDRTRTVDTDRPGWVARDKALRTVERYSDKGTTDSADRVERLVRSDPTGGAARYVTAVGAPEYASAFQKMCADPTTGHLRFTGEEVEAFRVVTAAQAEQRAALTTTTTGIPIPYELDPTLLISGTGALNPIRQIARVELVSEGTVKFATSAEVSAAYAAEGTEASDNTPAMTQPSVTTARGQAFIPYSFEVGQDWATVVENLSRLLADARNVLDATQFLTGNGSNAPGGILNIGGTGGLTTTQRVLSAGAGAIAIGDVYALKQAEPARFFPNSTFAMHPTRLDSVYRLVAAGSTTEPQIMPDGRNGPLLGKPVVEWSAMTTAVATGSKWALFGDFTQFVVCDRLGFGVELIPHLFGATSRFPTGQRGLYAFWRTGTGTLVQNAFRYGETS
jgi:HK97 family phage major capsid protein